MKNKLNLLFISILGLMLVLACEAPRNGTQSEQSTVSSAPPLKLLSARGERGYNYITITGEVQNISTEKLETIWVVVSHYDKQGQLITSENSVIDYTPLMPNQTSPFRSMARDNPLMDTYKIGFKTTFGGQVEYIDGRTPDKEPQTKKKRK